MKIFLSTEILLKTTTIAILRVRLLVSAKNAHHYKIMVFESFNIIFNYFCHFLINTDQSIIH